MATMLYSATMSLDGFIAGPGGGPHFVLTRRPPDLAVADMTVVDDPEMAVAAAKEAAGDK